MAATERGTADIELFIGGISKVLGERDIADIIKQHADVEPVELRLMRDTHGDRGPVNESKGFGFAKVSQIAEAERMLQPGPAPAGQTSMFKGVTVVKQSGGVIAYRAEIRMPG